MSFLGVYQALYAYVPQAEGELAIEEGDILYLLEKSEVDDWWTVKKRVVGSDAEEPQGLVPSTYIEPASTIGSATALYDYDRQTDEEVSFKEGDVFEVFDDKDPDWILVSKNGAEFGFVPSNYIEMRSGASAAPVQPPASFAPPPAHPSLAASTTQATAEPPSSYSAPPQRETRYSPEPQEEEEEAPPLPSKPRPDSADYSRRESASSSRLYDDDEDDYEAPPPKPSRPSETNSRSDSYSRRPSRAEEEDDKLYTWSVSEVDGRKKKKAMFAIGSGNIYFSSDAAASTPRQWKAKDLLSFSSEKKHVFLEFKNPLYSLEIHTGTKDVAAEILTVLGELKGSVSSTELKEVQAASSSKGSGKKQGKILYAFEAEGSDELTVKDGETVTIINDTKSKDWWLVQNKSGRSGVVPAQFVEPIAESTSSWSKFKLSRSKSKDNLKESPKKTDSKGLALPKTSRVRTWEDRTGTFKVDAEFLGVVDGKVHLHKTNGVKIGVAAQKLSLTDLEYVERVTGMSLEAFKVKSAKGKSKSTSSSNAAASSSSARDREERERQERKERERKRREREEREREMDALERSRAEERREREREALERERERKERELERREREMDREERERLQYELAEAKRKLKELDDIKRKLAEIPPAKPARPAAEPESTRRVTSSGSKREEYDWFEFFLEAGVDVNQCQRYSNNFSNEQIDPSILESIDAAVLRTLGLREGDIIRVTKYIDQKFDRKPAQSAANTNGSLFSEQGGALKVNRTGSSNQVTGSLPSPTKAATQPASADDDAWTVKPAANAEASAPKAGGLQTQQFTGSMQDLVNLKPLEPTKTSGSIRSQTYTPTPSKPMELTAQPTGVALDPFKTGGGNLLPMATGAGFMYLPIQQTGILATGMMPLQKTGGLVPLQKTGGLVGIPTGGLVPLQKTGGIQPMPLQRTGGIQPMPLQRTGGLPATMTGGLPAALTGGLPQTSFGMPATSFGAAMPTTSFGATMPTTSFGQPMMAQRTGGLNPMATGFTGALPQTSFGAMPTGGFPQTSFGANPMMGQTTGFQGQPQTSFGAAFPQTSFGAAPTGGLPMMNQMTGFQSQPQQPFQTGMQSLSSPPTFNTGAPAFNQQMNGLTNAFQNTTISQPQQPFQTGFQQQQPFTTGFQQQQQMPAFGQQMPQATFGQQMPQATFGQMQPLEAQPTGFGFGNTPSNGKADLSKATADNPFGF